VNLVGFIIRIYHDARSSECQTRNYVIISISVALRRNVSRSGEFAAVNSAPGKGDRRWTTENSLTGGWGCRQTVGATKESKRGKVESYPKATGE